MKKVKELFSGLSLNWDKGFIRNLVIAIGVVGVWRGMWDVLDHYFFPNNPLLSDLLCIVFGLLLLYLPDGSWHQLGDFSGQEKKK